MVKWGVKSIEEFKEICTHENITRFEKREKVLNKSNNFVFFEEEKTAFDAYQKTSDIHPLDVNYFINEYGFRGDWSLTSSKKKLLFVGCSFTFGWGLKDDDTFVKLISTNLFPEYEVINIGIAGCSIDTNVRFFKYITDIVDIDTVIFNLPPPFRTELPENDNRQPLFNIVAQIEYIPKRLLNKFNSWVELNDDEYLKYRTGKNLSMIEIICNSKNINSYFTTYDKDLYQYLNNFIHKKQILPFFNQLELESKFGFGDQKLKTKFARDGSHPGVHSNKIFAENVIKFFNYEK